MHNGCCGYDGIRLDENILILSLRKIKYNKNVYIGEPHVDSH